MEITIHANQIVFGMVLGALISYITLIYLDHKRKNNGNKQ